MRIDVVTLFPELFEAFFKTSFVGRAASSGAVTYGLKSPRDHGLGKHRSVDDTPYGGGSGMVMRVDVLVETLEALDASQTSPPEAADEATAPAVTSPPATADEATAPAVTTTLEAVAVSGEVSGEVADIPRRAPRAHRVLLTPQGSPMSQAHAKRFAEMPWIALVCGRYEGFDERVRLHVDEEVSLGDFVMTGGEVAAMAVIEATVRLLPGVLGNASSVEEESHGDEGLLEYPQYTRPHVFRDVAVPEVLSGGNHAKIKEYRDNERVERTRVRRPDLFAAYEAKRPEAPTGKRRGRK